MQRNTFTRRAFTNLCAGAYAWTGAAALGVNPPRQSEVPEARRRIRGAKIGEPVLYPNSRGDTWIATWADDDNIYMISDDTLGFDKACDSNLAVHRISGDIPPALHGVTINPMKEYGSKSEARRDDLGMWKACGIISVDGVLYLSVSRHLNPQAFGLPYWFGIQQSWDASIIKSADHGQTWSAQPEIDRPMFPGRTFSTPFFVEYGKDGQGTKDGADRYVYAVSNDGAWNNGNWMTLGRVRKDRIGRLESKDWEFVRGYNSDGSAIWHPRHDMALYIFRNPGRTSMAGMHYIAPLDVYILAQWYYPSLPWDPNDPVRPWQVTRLEFYEAPASWGPWTLFHTHDSEPQGWYNPSIPSKFISGDGQKLWLFVAGCPTTKYYALYMMPMTLDVK